MSRPSAYVAPRSLDECADALEDLDPSEVAVIGGGTVVVPQLTLGEIAPRRLVDLARAGLATIEVRDDQLVLGAMTTYTQVLTSEIVARHAPLLRAVASSITGGPQIQNRGTVGGSASRANPASDIPTALVALGARMVLRGSGGARQVEAGRFFLDAFRADLRRGEFLAQLLVPHGSGETLYGYYKLKTCGSSWPIVTAACALTRTGGCVERGVLALGGVTATPIRIDLAPFAQRAGSTRELLRDLAEHVRASAVIPWSDELADGAYRVKVVGIVLRRAVSAALDQPAPT
jgi:CO/xanthine dehydrogenase FAD-binding subunit